MKEFGKHQPDQEPFPREASKGAPGLPSNPQEQSQALSESELKRRAQELQARFARSHLEEMRAVAEQDPTLFASRTLEGIKAVVELGHRNRRVKDKLEDELRPYMQARIEAYRRTRNPDDFLSVSAHEEWKSSQFVQYGDYQEGLEAALTLLSNYIRLGKDPNFDPDYDGPIPKT
jgi:hypothetical protein